MTTTALRRNLGTAIALGLCVVVIVTAAVLRANTQSQLDELTRSTNAALCSFKSDLERRYAAGVDFLAEHPDGIPGISAADIQRSLNNQKGTLNSLASLECERKGT